MNNKWQSLRKKNFVNARIQGRILGRIAVYWVLYHFVLWIGLFVFHVAQYRSGITSGAEILPLRDLYRQFCFEFYPLIICAALILPAFMFDFVRMTHRVAGPLIRFRSALQDLMAGKRVEQVELRKRDMLNEFQDEFNEFLNFYNAQLDTKGAVANSKAFETALMGPDDISKVADVPDRDLAQNPELGETAVMINI